MVGTGLFSHRAFVYCYYFCTSANEMCFSMTENGEGDVFQSPRACKTTQEMTENDEGDANMFQSPHVCETLHEFNQPIVMSNSFQSTRVRENTILRMGYATGLHSFNPRTRARRHCRSAQKNVDQPLCITVLYHIEQDLSSKKEQSSAR